MQVSTGKIVELSDSEYSELETQRIELKDHKFINMTRAQVVASENMSSRQRRGYMMKQPCDCGSNKQARKCCFKDN